MLPLPGHHHHHHHYHHHQYHHHHPHPYDAQLGGDAPGHAQTNTPTIKVHLPRDDGQSVEIGHNPFPNQSVSHWLTQSVQFWNLWRRRKITQGDNTLSNLAMHSTHLLMKGVKDTMDFTKDFFNPFQVWNLFFPKKQIKLLSPTSSGPSTQWPSRSWTSWIIDPTDIYYYLYYCVFLSPILTMATARNIEFGRKCLLR